mgnify:FL=1
MNILYCGDKNIIDGLIISILSLLKNTNEILNIYVLTASIKLEEKEYKAIASEEINILDKILKEKNSNNFVKVIDITKKFAKEVPLKNIKTRFTPCCMLRLFADEIPELPKDRILYLDNDVICRKDCSDFYNQNIDDTELVGVLDYYGKWFFKKKNLKFDYINSGVLLLNINKIKETKLFEKARKMCIEKKMFMPDQSALNKLSVKKRILPRKYNEQRRLKKDTVIQHFTTSFRIFPVFHSVTIKPWNIENVHKKLKIFEYDDLFEEYEEIIKQIKN